MIAALVFWTISTASRMLEMRPVPNKFFILILLALIFCGCSKKDFNLPQPSPMPGRESAQTEFSACAIVFTQEQSWSEVAIVANEMQERCGYSKTQVLRLARDFTDKSEYTR